MDILLNQSEYAELHGIKRQRVGQIIASGELMTKKVGARIFVVDCKFNTDVVKRFTGGKGHWSRPMDTPRTKI